MLFVEGIHVSVIPPKKICTPNICIFETLQDHTLLHVIEIRSSYSECCFQVLLEILQCELMTHCHASNMLLFNAIVCVGV